MPKFKPGDICRWNAASLGKRFPKTDRFRIDKIEERVHMTDMARNNSYAWISLADMERMFELETSFLEDFVDRKLKEAGYA